MKRPAFVLYVIACLLSYSRAFCQEPKLMLPIGHSLGVSTAEFSPDGKRMVTCALDNNAKIWEISTGLLLADLRGHTDTVMSARFSPDGKKILTACQDGTAKIWDANSTSLLVDLRGHTGQVFVAEFSPDGKKIVTASDDNTIKIWETVSGKLLANLTGHTKAIWLAWFSPDGKKIVSASDDSTAKVWDVVSGKLLVDFQAHTAPVLSVMFSSDGKKIITGSDDSTAKVWDAETGKVLYELKGHKKAVRYTSFNTDGKRVLTGSDDGRVKIWNAENGDLMFDLLGKQKVPGSNDSNYDIVSAVNFSPDGKKVLTVYLDSSFKIWDVFTGKLLRVIKKEMIYTNSAGFSSDGKRIVLALASGNAQIYDVEKGTLLVDLKGIANNIASIVYSSDGKRILISNQYGSAKILDAATGTLVANLPADKGSKGGVFAYFSPDGKKIVATAFTNTARVYDAVTGTQLLDLIGHKGRIYTPGFSPDGKIIYTYSIDNTCKIWDATTGKLLVDIKAEGTSGLGYAGISPDSKKIFTTTWDSTVLIWNTENGHRIAELKGHKKRLRKVEFSPDSKKIFTASMDSTIKIWNTETGALIADIKKPGFIGTVKFSPDSKRIFINSEDFRNKFYSIKMHDAETGNLITELTQSQTAFLFSSFSPDGKKLIIPFEDSSIKLYDAETGNYIKELNGLIDNISAYIKFSPDGKKIVAGGNDGLVKIWDAETGELLKELKEHSFRIHNINFSPDGKRMLTNSGDYTTKIWDAETGKSLYTFISVGNDDYLVTDKDNHFDGTEAARRLLYFTCGTEVIELDQVKDQLWVPNLAERILNGETINAAKLSELNICNLTPVVETIEQTAMQYRFRITPRLGGLSATIVYVNGIEVKRYTAQQMQQQKNDYVLSVEKKELQKFFVAGKENTIVVKSLTAKNSISSRSVSIHEKGNEKSTAPPNLYAIVVGVSDYKGEELDLKFAAKDAADMADALDNSAKKLLNTDGKEHVFVYKIHTGTGRDKFPEKNSIRQLFTDIGNKAQPNDILLIFFAGHGVMETEKNQFYFLTADASTATVSGALKNVGISTEEIAEWIKPQMMKAQKRILIFDACNSGQVIKELVSLGQKGQNFLASRGDDKGKQIKAVEKLNEKSGMFILSASASDQKAYEIGKYNQGALTYSLLKAIKEEPDILEDRKYLNISRWFNAAEKTVGELAKETGTRQQPQVVSTTNFNIGVVDDEVRNNIVLPFEKALFTRSDFRNVELRIDNLKLRTLVDKELDEISGNSSVAPFMYSPEYDGPKIYAINGDYTITGNDINVSVIVLKGGTEIKTKFEIKGSVDQPGVIAKTIIISVKEWLSNKN